VYLLPGRVARIGPFGREPVGTQTSAAARADGLEREVTELLLERARTEGVSLAGPGGLLSGVTKTVLETALDAETPSVARRDSREPAV